MNCFVSEPVHNLVHREAINSDGVLFKSHRAADEPEEHGASTSEHATAVLALGHLVRRERGEMLELEAGDGDIAAAAVT